jgi:ribosomal RNA-processing protein 12
MLYNFIMFSFVPLAKKPRKCKELQAWSDQLWNLLPAFCRYPSDVYQNFGSLSKLLVEMLKCDRCLYKSACKGLQVEFYTLQFSYI